MLDCGIPSPSFRLTHRPGQKPYLVISPLVQVDDTREPLLNPDDRQIGERWMTSVMGCVLGNIAAKSQCNSHFPVNEPHPCCQGPGTGRDRSQSLVRLNHISWRDKQRL